MNKEQIVEVWKKYKSEFDYDKEKAKFNNTSMYDVVEAEMLYSVVRAINPLKVIEIGAYSGWTSSIIIKALEANEFQSQLLSLDLIDKSKKYDQEGKVTRKLIVGDAMINANPEVIANCDFLFIDAEHTNRFSQWYCETIFPLIRKNILIFIHDWEGKECDKDGEFSGVIKYGVETGLVKRVFNIMDFVIENKLSRSPKVGYALGDRSPTEVLIKV